MDSPAVLRCALAEVGAMDEGCGRSAHGNLGCGRSSAPVTPPPMGRRRPAGVDGQLVIAGGAGGPASWSSHRIATAETHITGASPMR